MEDYRRKLEQLNPNVTLSVELPHQGNGDLFQVRTTIADGLIFYGRATTEDEAILKCCQKAVKHLLKNNNNLIASETHHHSRRQSSKPPQSPARPPSRRSRETPRPHPHRGLSSREAELRNEMGSVLDRVAEWSRYYDHNGNSEYTNNNDYGNRRRTNTSRRGSDREPERPPRRTRRNPPASGKVRSPSPSVSSTSEAAATSKSPNSLLSEEVLASLKGKTVQLKNAVMMLNEMFPPPRAPQYKVTSQTGPPNNPTFSMVCCIDDQTFQGEGKSKKEAKLACSQQAIEAIVGIKISENRTMPEKSNPRANCDLDDWMELEGKNPVSILNELYPGIQYQLISTSGPSHAPQFVIRASLNDMSFEGSGKSKKDAKLNASKALLVHLHKVGFDPMTGDMMSTQQNNSEVADGHSFADKIGQLVTSKYQALFGTTTYSKRRVMSGIVMTRMVVDEEDVKEETFEVICVSSGTKCINGEQLSLEGCVINDSHAEIVSRRCIIYYLYSQLENYDAADPEKSILEIADDGKFKLKDGIGFHLFITTSPCGDARIFSLHESSTAANPEATKAKIDTIEEVVEAAKVSDDSETKETSSEIDADKPGQDQPEIPETKEPEVPEKVITKEPEPVTEEVRDPNKNPNELENYGNDVVAIYVTKAEEPKKRESKPVSDSSRGMLRSKIECGMGTVPLSPKMHLQTWDGVMSGDRLLTMACSDKILRWNVLGIQGALLTHFLHPIYLKSITVGSKFHPGHMKRALYERIANHVGPLPSDNYILNRPQLYATTSPETRQATKAHDYSVNWILDHGQPEIVNGSTGKTINESTSRLSKKALFGRFMKINSELPIANKRVFSTPIQYSAVKQLATDYQKAKAQVTTALMTAGCGHWIEKPVEQDQFSL